MLVHYAEPNGVLYIGGFRVYGSYWGRSPVDIPYALYKDNKGLFKDATYRSQYLSSKFGQSVDEIAFTVRELKHLPFPTLLKLASQLGVGSLNGNDRTRGKIVKAILEALQNVT